MEQAYREFVDAQGLPRVQGRSVDDEDLLRDWRANQGGQPPLHSFHTAQPHIVDSKIKPVQPYDVHETDVQQ